MTPTLQTARLLLLPVSLDDVEQVQRIFPQWEVVKYLNARCPWPFPPDGVLTHWRDEKLPATERGEEWNWTIRLRSAPDQIVGSMNLSLGDNNRGFWLAPELHNRGLMTEAVIAVNDFWFDTLGFTVLRVPKAAANLASRRISEKTGMRLVAIEPDHAFVSGRMPAEIWELTGDEWHAARAQLLAGKEIAGE
jgi:RimJ/RimL family protein N-acetyltransferase